MALKKGDRIEVTRQDEVLHGFVYKGGAKLTMILDDGKRRLSGPAHLFRASAQAVPADSPFAKAPPKKRARVEFDHEGEVLRGEVISANRVESTVLIDGGEFKISLRTSDLRPTDVSAPRDEPSPMDRWTVVNYRPVRALSHETVAFTAQIAYDGEVVLSAENSGQGGCNMYHGPRDIVDKLERDARCWAVQFGLKNPFEASDLWTGWAGEEKPKGVLARRYLSELQAAMDDMRAPAPSPAP